MYVYYNANILTLSGFLDKIHTPTPTFSVPTSLYQPRTNISLLEAVNQVQKHHCQPCSGQSTGDSSPLHRPVGGPAHSSPSCGRNQESPMGQKETSSEGTCFPTGWMEEEAADWEGRKVAIAHSHQLFLIKAAPSSRPH